nr:S41 family peptidase [Acetanaerobacterium elongatum]
MPAIFAYIHKTRRKRAGFVSNLSFVGNKTLIIDSGCFSTCGHFAAVFKANNLGYVLGEPTGGGAVCTDGATDTILRNTGIRLHCSQNMYGVVANESMRNTVKPDKML